MSRPDGVPEDQVEGSFGGDVAAARGQGDHQLDLVVEVGRGGGEVELAAVGDHSGGRLGEEERRLAVGVVAHLDGVLGVVAPDAEDPTHREHLVSARRRGASAVVPGRRRTAGWLVRAQRLVA